MECCAVQLAGQGDQRPKVKNEVVKSRISQDGATQRGIERLPRAVSGDQGKIGQRQVLPMFCSHTSITTRLAMSLAAGVALVWPAGAGAQTGVVSPALATALVTAPAALRSPAISPLSLADSTVPTAAWRAVGLPGKSVPLTGMDVVTLEGARVLRLRTQGSYGTLVHAVAPWVPGPDASLRWRWRLEQPLVGADLRRKDGDDAALKVCVMFDLPLQGIPFVERSLLRMARAASSEPLPAATVCYVWDTTLARDTRLANPFSGRVRYLVADGADSLPGNWRLQQRRLADDFLQLFGEESSTVPAIIAVAVGADADNTGGRSLAYIADLTLSPDSTNPKETLK
jgi:hypothetical protein